MNKFGCQSAERTCTSVADFKEMYKVSGGLEIFNISEAGHIRICHKAQQRLGEIAAFKGVTYAQLLERYTERNSNNCPISVLLDEESVDIPTLLE